MSGTGAVAAADDVTGLRALAAPRAIAVLGASRRSSNFGRRIFEHLREGGFHGPVYPVNPRAAEIDGHVCYPALAALPGPVDMAVVAVPRDEVLRAIDECAAAGVRSVVVITAGFAETGNEGRELQQTLLARVRANGMRMIGPNCMGIVNAAAGVRMNASFVPQLPPAGHLAIASQSGGVGLALLELASARQLGISTFLSLGNKADVSGNDFLVWGDTDAESSVLMLYLESLGNPRRFGQLARRIARRKPIVVVKAGRSRAGSRAAGSHTAGLASSDTAVASLFAQSGVIRADTIDQMFDVAQCLDLQPLPEGYRVGIVTNTGGPGILAADACEAHGLVVAPLDETTRDRLRAVLSPQASTGNPIDLVASAAPDAYAEVIPIMLASPEIDSLMVLYTPIEPAATPAVLASIGAGVARARAEGSSKTVIACTFSLAQQPAPLVAAGERLPVFMFPENAALALARAATYARWRRQPPSQYANCPDAATEQARRVCRTAAATRGDTWLTHGELSDVLADLGLTLLGTGVRSADAAVAAASRFGYPVAMKIDVPGVVHKTEAKGVVLGLDAAPAVRAAFTAFAERFPEVSACEGAAAVIVQPMVRGTEVLVGMVEEPTFGPLVAFGLGGVEAEILHDVAFRLAPLSTEDIDALCHGIRAFPLLQGYRGRPPADLAALRAVIERVSLLACAVPELRELDLNPVIVRGMGQGCALVDARARVVPVPVRQSSDRATV